MLKNQKLKNFSSEEVFSNSPDAFRKANVVDFDSRHSTRPSTVCGETIVAGSDRWRLAQPKCWAAFGNGRSAVQIVAAFDRVSDHSRLDSKSIVALTFCAGLYRLCLGYPGTMTADSRYCC